MMSLEKLFPDIEPTTQKQGGRKDQPTHSSQELPMMESGRVDSEMAMVFRNGQMVPYMKVNGKIIELTVKVNSLISTVTSTKANGSTTKPTETESTSTQTAPDTKANGTTTNNTEKD